MRIIPRATTTDTLRRAFFTLVDATDLITPEDIDVTGVKPTLSVDGVSSTGTADIVKVNGSAGEYYFEFSSTEVTHPIGTLIRGWLQPSGCALTKFQVQIGPAGSVVEPLQIGSLRDDAISLAQSFSRTNSTMTLKNSAGVDVVSDITTDPTLEPISTITEQ